MSEDISLLSGVVTARPVGEHRSCWESKQHLWLNLLPTLCCSALVLLGSCSFDTSDLKESRASSSQLFDCRFSVHTRCYLCCCECFLTLTEELKLFFKYAEMRNVESKPIPNIKENISSNTRQYVLSHIYNRHDNFIEACDVVRQIWVG